MHISAHISIGKHIPGDIQGKCPHCSNETNLISYELISRFSGIPLPNSKAFQCDSCGQFSRKENAFLRTINALFLFPVIVLVLMTFIIGIVAIPYSLYLGTFEMFVVIVSLILVSVSTYILWKLYRFLKRNFARKDLQPLGKSLMTEL